MYRLTPRMEQHFRQSLARYHELFDGNRCKGWELEELIVKAIRSDTTANHLPRWQEAGHDDRADIVVRTNGAVHSVQVKSGQIKAKQDVLTLSEHRLGRFKGDLRAITEYLNNREADIIAVPYRQDESDEGRKHIYRVCYVPVTVIKGVDAHGWVKKGAQYQARNGDGVLFSLRPSMSWQIWWTVPVSAVVADREFTDGRFIDNG